MPKRGKQAKCIELDPHSWALRTVAAVLECQVALFPPRQLPCKERIQQNTNTVRPFLPRIQTDVEFNSYSR